MGIRWYCLLLTITFCDLIQRSECHLSITVAPTNGNNTKCLSNNFTTPCRTLKFALNYVLGSVETSVDIHIEESQYLIDEPLQIHTDENRSLLLRLFSKQPTIRFTCTDVARRIFNVFGRNLFLEFYNITFENCGRNAWAKYAEVMPAITVTDTNKVSFYSCAFQDNNCSALFVENSNVHIEYCRFVRNTNKFIYSKHLFRSNMSAFSGGIGILFPNGSRKNMSVNVFHTTFINNSVHADGSKYYVAHKQENAVKNGGAIHVTFIDKSSSWTTINITSCRFEGNNATFGGALLIELFGATLYNEIFISSNQFIRNYGAQAGGAFLLSFWDYSAKTRLKMVNSLFEENLSKSGSAIYVFLQSYYSSPQESEEILLFKYLNIARNSGPVGSAVKIASHLYGPRSSNQIPVFENCLFINNINSALNGYAYLPSFIIDRVNIVLNGSNTFIGNSFFGAAYFSNSLIQVYGKLHFLRNMGLQGGAISSQNSQIVVHPGSDLLFQDNFASFGGGAINVVTNVAYHVGVKNNPFCFLVYSNMAISPNEWNVNISFINNSATLRGPAICIDSLMMCAWDSYSQKLDFKKTLKWKPTFYYEGNALCPSSDIFELCYARANGTEAISTYVSSLEEKNGIETIKTCPGEVMSLEMVARDELNNSVFSIVADKVSNSDSSQSRWLQSPETFTPLSRASNTVKFKYTYNSSFEIPMNTAAEVYYYDIFSNGRVFVHFSLRPQACRPGFVQENELCVCDKNKTGILGCTEDGHFVQYEEGYWVGVINGVFTVFPCPYGYCSCPDTSRQSGTEVSGCFFNVVNGTETDVCANNRNGKLCGDCQENYTVGIQTFRCVPKHGNTSCQWTNVFSFIFTIMFCIIILYFNPGLDNELRGPLFFFQVLPLFFPPTQYTTKGTINVYNFVFFLSSIFDFTIPFFGYLFSQCYILNDQDNLDMLAWSYSSSVIALLVSLVAFFLSYKRVILIRRKNAVQCFWVLLILMYSSLMNTSLNIVDCASIQGKLRLFAQASVICYKGKHLVLSIVAYTILILGVIIPILILVLTTTNRLNIAPHYLDTLTNNLKERCVFWWSVDLLRRLLIVALGDFMHIWKHKQVALVIATTFILTIHCYFQPYEETRANFSEMIFLFVLSALGVFQMMDIADNDRDRTNLAIVILMWLYTLILVMIKLVAFVKNRANTSTDNEDYERLEDTSPPDTSNLASAIDQTLEDRREKLAYLFSRSETPPPQVNRDSDGTTA
ncbi:uncharacterized protein LOC114527054 [Dendronephthya gigantea]|uniref:uncharacterized protein LOC114527054 n=1 Tax=Dendronephthya gigantea TaxID=151771 RepID=UPI00106A9B30|nr:uncharacterized protein LOC114527054 [Dendronephthya gigantea]